MKRLTIQDAELSAQQFRTKNLEIGFSEPINIKSALRKLSIFTMYRPLSEKACGISVKAPNGKMFILINSNSTRGRQHFTIAHEFYHLFYDKDPKPHICCAEENNGVEKDANLFASVLLLPREGLLKTIPSNELKACSVSLATILRIEQYFQVSRQTLLYRLRGMDIIGQKQLESFNDINVKESAQEYGYDLALYQKGNEGLVIGDFGEKARLLFEQGKISEGHYIELLNMLSDE